MLLNKRHETRPLKLYHRIVLFFVLAFSFLLILSFIMIFYFSQQIVFNENRSNLIKFNSYIINVLKDNDDAILELPPENRLNFISEKIYPNIKDNTLISYKISDNLGNAYLSAEGIEALLNHENFNGYNTDLFKLNIDNPSNKNENNINVESIRYNKIEYYYLGSNYPLSKDYTLYIQVVKNLDDSFVYMTALLSIQITISIISLVFIIIIGIYGTKRSLKPLIEIANTAKNITENNLNTRIKETGNGDELDQLIKSLNQMIGQLETAFGTQKQFVSDASHELRIPLTIIQGYADILASWGKDTPQLLDESVDSIKEEIQKMKKLVEELLLLTRLDNDYFNQKFEESDLNKLLSTVYRECEMIDPNHQFIYKASQNAGVVRCNEPLILQALRGLADNSMKYTQKDGIITFECIENEKNCTLLVSDTGIGIPNEALKDVKNRFFRVDDDRSRESGGSGLGLSIIESIVNLHHGDFIIESTPGEGTSVRILLNK